jgi:hypothetical protein
VPTLRQGHTSMQMVLLRPVSKRSGPFFGAPGEEGASPPVLGLSGGAIFVVSKGAGRIDP